MTLTILDRLPGIQQHRSRRRLGLSGLARGSARWLCARVKQMWWLAYRRGRTRRSAICLGAAGIREQESGAGAASGRLCNSAMARHKICLIRARGQYMGRRNGQGGHQDVND